MLSPLFGSGATPVFRTVVTKRPKKQQNLGRPDHSGREMGIFSAKVLEIHSFAEKTLIFRPFR